MRVQVTRTVEIKVGIYLLDHVINFLTTKECSLCVCLRAWFILVSDYSTKEAFVIFSDYLLLLLKHGQMYLLTVLKGGGEELFSGPHTSYYVVTVVSAWSCSDASEMKYPKINLEWNRVKVSAVLATSALLPNRAALTVTLIQLIPRDLPKNQFHENCKKQHCLWLLGSLALATISCEIKQKMKKKNCSRDVHWVKSPTLHQSVVRGGDCQEMPVKSALHAASGAVKSPFSRRNLGRSLLISVSFYIKAVVCVSAPCYISVNLSSSLAFTPITFSIVYISPS